MLQKYLGAEQIAESVICKFMGHDEFSDINLNKGNQRIILVAAHFRKEVTSTVLWLLNYGISVKCIKVTPYLFNGAVLIDTEQIIPIKEAEEYQIGVARKELQEKIKDESTQNRHTVRINFWNKLLPEMKAKTNLFSYSNSSKENWISWGVGLGNIYYALIVTGYNARVELWLEKPDISYNKQMFDNLHIRKDEIEGKFGSPLYWKRLDEQKRSIVGCQLDDVSVFNEDDWDKMIAFLVENAIKLDVAFKDELSKAAPGERKENENV
jgi:hypothetical protein